METAIKEFKDERGICVQWNMEWVGRLIDGVIFITFSTDNDNSFFANVNIVINDLKEDFDTLEKYSILTLQQLEEKGIGDNIEGYSDFLWAGCPAKLLKYNAVLNGKELVILQCWAITNNKVFTLTYTSTPNQYEFFFNDVIDIIDTTYFFE